MFEENTPTNLPTGQSSAPASSTPPAPKAQPAPQPSVSQNPSEPDDMFGDMEMKPPTPKAPTAGTAVAPPLPGPSKKKGGMVKILVGIIILIAVAIIVIGLFTFLRQPEQPEGIPDVVDSISEVPEAIPGIDENVTPPTPTPTPVTTPSTTTPTQPKDSDGDGLIDEDEINIGTSINNPDTDGDGLSDKDEVSLYNTNPLNPDTDSDGYLDGEEVKNGFNPNGSGKLLEVPPAS